MRNAQVVAACICPDPACGRASRPQRRAAGFSLLELLLIVSFMLILSAIAIPRYMTVRQQATASAAVSNLRSVNTALAAYSSAYPSIGYPAALTNLGPSTGTPTSTTADLVDQSLANAGSVPKQGYTITYTPSSTAPAQTYTVTGAPGMPFSYRFFYTDESFVIRFNDGSAATSASTPIG